MYGLMQKLRAVEDCAKIQTSDPSSKTDPYMRGLANGMIFCLATLHGVEPKYIDAPDKDIPLFGAGSEPAMEEPEVAHV